MQAWNVYLYGKNINTVYFNKGIDQKYVYDSLVNHDGFNPNIKVRKG